MLFHFCVKLYVAIYIIFAAMMLADFPFANYVHAAGYALLAVTAYILHRHIKPPGDAA